MTVQGFEEAAKGRSGRAIIIWHGTLSSIPEGWVLCDGNNGTPDLRGRFAKAANVSGNVGRTGGVDSFTLSTGQMPSHSHSVAGTDTQGDHSHGYGKTTSAYPSDGRAGYDPTTVASGENTGSGGGHSHSINDNNAGGSSSINNLPKYYEAAFIMRL